MFLMALEQRRQGHKVSVYCLFRGGEVADRLIQEEIPVEVFSGQSRIDRFRAPYRWFQRDRIEVAHLHNASATIFGAPAARLAGVQSIISTRHGLVSPPYKQKQEAFYAGAVRLANIKVVGVCTATSKNLRGIPMMPQKSVRTIYNGAIPALRTNEDILSEKDGFTFVTVGRLAPPKDHAGLIQAFAVSYAKRPDLRLWIVGDGILRAQLEERVAELKLNEAVRFWGSRSNVGDFLAAADAFTLISFSEGLPVSQLEAMAAGLPLVVSHAGAMPELVHQANCGWVVPVNDSAAISDALLECAENESLRRQYGENSERSFQQNFQLENMVQAYEELYLLNTKLS